MAAKKKEPEYRAAVVIRDSAGVLFNVAQWLGATTSDFGEALETAEKYVVAGTHQETVVLKVAAVIAVKRETVVRHFERS